MREPTDGALERPTDQDAQQLDNSPDLEDAVVAAGGATVSQQMKLHLEGCPCLGNAVEVREPTDGERRSRDWCETCAVGTEQTPNFDAYNALANADADDVDRGDGVETDGGEDNPNTEIEGATWDTYSKTETIWAVKLPVDVTIHSREGRIEAKAGDYLCVDSAGGLYPSDAETFEEKYQRSSYLDRGDGIETDGGVDPVSVPPEFDEFPHEARRFVLSQANDAADIRVAVNNRVGLSNDDLEADRAGRFTKDELAAVLLALGGPDR